MISVTSPSDTASDNRWPTGRQWTSVECIEIRRDPVGSRKLNKALRFKLDHTRLFAAPTNAELTMVCADLGVNRDFHDVTMGTMDPTLTTWP
jgi:hypothetical protein